MEPRGLIFDLDGVLVDSEPLHLEAARAVLARHGGWVTEEENRAFVGRPEEDFWATFAPRFGIDAPWEDLLRQRIEAFRALLGEGRRVDPLPGVLDAVEAARTRGIRLAVASSSPRALVEPLLEAAGLRPFFPVVLSAEDVRRPKPDPEIYRLAARRLGVRPARAVVVEDSEAGAEAALAAGLTCWVIRNAYSRSHRFPPGVRSLASAREIPGLLDALAGSEPPPGAGAT